MTVRLISSIDERKAHIAASPLFDGSRFLACDSSVLSAKRAGDHRLRFSFYCARKRRLLNEEDKRI